MNTHTLTILNIEITFKTELSNNDIEKAKMMLESRAEQIYSQGKTFNKEKILLFVALGLAYNWIQANAQLSVIPGKLESILSKCDKDSILL
ncbi:MAG: cell division protein ZapA [Desulfovibrionaceae bacterium]